MGPVAHKAASARHCVHAETNGLFDLAADRITISKFDIDLPADIQRGLPMPIHDWSRVPSGLFHHFHQSWSIRMSDALNGGLLPPNLSALVERRAGVKEPDILAIEDYAPLNEVETSSLERRAGSTATLEAPASRIVQRSSEEIYAGRANRIVVRHHLGRIVAVIEIVSPGNKDKRGAIRNFVDKTVEFIEAGVHVLVVDLFPPTVRDPKGLHKLIWDEIEDQPFELPDGLDRLLMSYQAGREKVAYIEPLAIGDTMPDMPLFLTPHLHVKVPLEATYEATWNVLPQQLRMAVTTGELPKE